MLSPRVDELLSEWEARRDAGETVRAEDLCAGDPQLLEEVRWAIHALEEVESRFGVSGAEDPEAVPSSTAALPVRDVDVNSRFRIERLHASGGLGRVYLAWDQHLHRRVAIKFPIGSKLTEQARRRFRREVDVTSRLDHPGVVPVHSLDDGDEGRLPCYVMRFVEGQTLHEAIEASRSAEAADSKARQSTARAVDTDPATPDDVPETSPLHRPAGTLDLTDLLQRFVTVCNIAGYAHSRGVIHRDIKPSNILLGDFGETLLLDWGLARVVGTADFEPVAADHLKSQVSTLKSIAPGSSLRPALSGLADEPGPAGVSAGAEAAEIALQAANSRLTVSGQVLGTPAFASPEQLLGDPSSLTARSDVYSLGATLFRILTGESLVRPDELPQYLEQLKSGTVSGVVSRMAHVPAALSAICGKALAVDPLQRYAAATELARDVERYLRDEPVSVSREPIWRRFLRWLRRHPRLSSSCAAALMAGFGVALLASLMLGRKNEQLSAAIDEAEAGRTQAINALRSLSDNVLASVLQQNTRLTRQQTSYLERVASQYSAFASATGDRPDALLLKAEGLAQCGAIHCALRQMPQAERELNAAIEILQSLDTDDVGQDVRTRPVSALLARAACDSRQYQYDAARRSLQKANALLP